MRGTGAAAAHLLGATQVLGVVSAGAAHGAPPALLGAPLLASPLAGVPAANSKAGAGPGGPRPGALRAGRCSGRAGERAGRPDAPTLINRFERAGLGSQSALGEAASSTPTSGSPSFSLPSFLLSLKSLLPHRPSEEETVGCSSGYRHHWSILSCLFGVPSGGPGKMQMPCLS